MDPKTILKVGKQIGLNAIAITDHNTIKGGVIARKTCEHDLIVIVGAEISTNVGDLIVKPQRSAYSLVLSNGGKNVS